MDSYQFYKSIYDRELNRRKDLDSAINLPLTILSILVAANSFIIKEKDLTDNLCQQRIVNILVIFIFIGLAITVFYLTRSYNNLFKGFAYRNLGLTTEIRKYETVDLPNYNNQVEEKDKLIFENIIINKLTNIVDNHIVFNDKRSRDLYIAKTFLIISMVITALDFFLIFLKNIKI